MVLFMHLKIILRNNLKMKTIILSIKPQYFEKILDGTKKYEYRTRIPKNNIYKIIIYSSYPVKKIIAEVGVLKVLKLTPEELWEATKDYGINYAPQSFIYI